MKGRPLPVYLVFVAPHFHVPPCEESASFLSVTALYVQGYYDEVPLNLFLSRVNRQNAFSYSSKDRFSSPLIKFAALIWTPSRLSTSVLNCVDLNQRQHSMCDLHIPTNRQFSFWWDESGPGHDIPDLFLLFELMQELESINEDVQAMSSCCEDMSSRLKVIYEEMCFVFFYLGLFSFEV